MTPPSENAADTQSHSLIDDGNRLEAARRFQEALALYNEARDCAPDLPRAHLNIGNVLIQLGDEVGAIAAFEAALARNPEFASAYFNLGNLYLARGETQRAITVYLRALQARPNFADAAVALGNAHYQLKQWDAAAGAYSRALELQPGYAQVYRNLGNVLAVQRKFSEALVVLREAVRFQPDDGRSLITAYHASLSLCDWSRRSQDEGLLVDMIDRGGEGIMLPLAVLNIDPPHRPAAPLQRDVGERYANHFVNVVPATRHRSPRPKRDTRRLRIGYLSADVCDHPVMHLLMGVLAAHDSSCHAIHFYSYGAEHDAMTAQISASVENFRDLSTLSDAQVAETIAADDIDILVNLQGYTENARLGITARRPAPVLVNWLGYPATLGHPRMADYIIGDPVVTPLQCAADFSETLALLPHCYLPNDQGRAIGPQPTREAAGLPAEGVVFANFNQTFKFSPATFDLWCRLVREAAGSVLWLKEASDPVKDNLRREAASRSIDPARLIFAPRLLSNADHLGRLALADLALDTFPYTSHTTACDALWVGVPLVTMRGSTFTSRVAASVLTSAGMGELVTADVESSFALAAALAQDAPRRARLRAQLLATRLSVPLFDTGRFTRNLEALFACMSEQNRSGRRESILLQDQAAPVK